MTADDNDVLTDDFLEAEMTRVIYNLEAFTRDRYLEIPRRGRPRLTRRQRELVWDILMEPGPIESFVTRRIHVFRSHAPSIDRGQRLAASGDWHFVFVDEAQDFTRPDLKLLAHLPPSPDRLCIAGDPHQAVHMSSAYSNPAIQGTQWKRHELKSSYRLPPSVCNAVRPLAAFIAKEHQQRDDDLDVEIQSMRSALPGPRPVVLRGNEELGAELQRVLWTYQGYWKIQERQGPNVFCAEEGQDLNDTLAKFLPDLARQSGPMLRYKGLEWPCVVVSTRGSSRDPSTLPERVFTALTRTTALLVIVIWPEDGGGALELLRKLDRAHLLFWDEDAERAFDAC